jgi:hypothetical protein
MEIGMKRTLYMGIFLGALWAVLAGCATGGDESKPDDAISLYLSAYLEGRYEEAYQYLSAEDRLANSLEAYVTERKDSGTFLTRNLHRLIRHDIREVTLVDEISGALQAANYPESALENVSFVRRNVGAFEQKYQTEGIPRRTLQENIELVKEGRQWKVRAGWGLNGPERR